MRIIFESMPKEIEVKILNVDKMQVIQRLKELGAKRAGHYNFKRIIFDIKNGKGRETWLRLRSDGKKSTLTLKDKADSSLSGTEELETEVKDFETAAKMLCMALPNPLYEENERIEYRLRGVTVTVDKWPLIPWLVEIEGPTEQHVRKIQKMLGIKGKDVGNISQRNAFKLYGINLEEFGKMSMAKLDRLMGNRRATKKRKAIYKY